MENVVNTQNTATSSKAQDIDGATIQWNVGTSTHSEKETFDFPQEFDTDNVAVIVNRTIANADDILPIISANKKQYEINRSHQISGNGQTFNMLAVGGKTTDKNYAHVKDSNGQTIAVVQWGKYVTSTDGNETFTFPTAFTTNCRAVVTNRTEKDGKTNLPVTEISKSSFEINRPNTIGGAQTFYWVAIGDCDANFSVPMGNGCILKGGYTESTTDSAENFTFPGGSFPNSCQSVVTTRTNSGCEDILPVSAMSKSNFTIDRSSGLVGDEGFYWIAVGQ